MKIVELVRTCIACPSQWDAKLDDGRPVYIRFRNNWCSVRIGEEDGNIWTAVRGKEVLGFEWGDYPMCGDMTDEQLVAQLLNRGWEVELKNGCKADNYKEWENYWDEVADGLEKMREEIKEPPLKPYPKISGSIFFLDYRFQRKI